MRRSINDSKRIKRDGSKTMDLLSGNADHSTSDMTLKLMRLSQLRTMKARPKTAKKDGRIPKESDFAILE